MATVVCSQQLLDNLARAFAPVHALDAAAAATMAKATITSLKSLELNPLLGRRASGDLRELVISTGSTGLVALYRYVVVLDEVRVHVLRRQRELGFRP